MANFPRPEADIKVLAQNIITGLTGNADFPNPPVTPAALQTLLDTFITSGDAQVAAQAAAQQATEAKHAAQDELTAAMKSVLRYAENVVQGNDAKLAALGWRPPNRAKAGCTWIGKPLRKAAHLPSTGMAVASEATLANQERGKAWEYRIIAVNKAGESGPSNTTTAVL